MTPDLPHKLKYSVFFCQNEPCHTQIRVAEVCVDLTAFTDLKHVFGKESRAQICFPMKLDIFYLLSINTSHIFPFRYVTIGGMSSNFKLT